MLFAPGFFLLTVIAARLFILQQYLKGQRRTPGLEADKPATLSNTAAGVRVGI